MKFLNWCIESVILFVFPFPCRPNKTFSLLSLGGQPPLGSHTHPQLAEWSRQRDGVRSIPWFYNEGRWRVESIFKVMRPSKTWDQVLWRLERCLRVKVVMTMQRCRHISTIEIIIYIVKLFNDHWVVSLIYKIKRYFVIFKKVERMQKLICFYLIY